MFGPSVIICLQMASLAYGLTCPGFPGYCSESFPGQTCVVVCSRGRNNVPLCQEDGTWTDIPRCIEHEPGVVEQIPGLCPGISGYCSAGYIGQRCQFRCNYGGDIDSTCTADGTWRPYPKCLGDIRESQDGCNPCPGPLGIKRNRTLEAIYRLNDNARALQVAPQDPRVPVPTFSGNQRIGPLARKEQGTLFRSKFGPRDFPSTPRTTTPLVSPTTPKSFRVFSSPRQVPPTAVEDPLPPLFRGNRAPPKANPRSTPPPPPPSVLRPQASSVQPIFQSLQDNFASSDSEIVETRFVFKNGKIVPLGSSGEEKEEETPQIEGPRPLLPQVLPPSKPRSLQQFGSFGPFQIFDPNAQRNAARVVHEAVPGRIPVPPSNNNNFGPFQTLVL
eukprot:TRINITY_DN2741_c0_g1_i4.p1 TRINITY_DN2741_c0_g1~~TRINITY_DN2741_c0_g1_i4.p1  ORF type:complete len:388 (+),score=78.25 TRINITY_DN2741_c0_g1_i4:97-1260(+)